MRRLASSFICTEILEDWKMRFVSRRWGYISELSDQMELTGFMILRNLLYQANLDGSSPGIVFVANYSKTYSIGIFK